MERPLDPARLGDHLDRLYRAAWALCGSREEAEDLVQETFARLLARPRLLRNEDDLGYLLRALRNTFLNQKRTESRRLRTGPLPEQLDLVADPRALQPQAALEAGELYAAVAALPGDFRDVLVAVDITGLSYKEAARALHIREGTVMSRLYRARQHVVRRIEGSPRPERAAQRVGRLESTTASRLLWRQAPRTVRHQRGVWRLSGWRGNLSSGIGSHGAA